MNRKIVFLTGTRADYGKIKPLMQALERNAGFDVHVFVCGMHLSPLHGSTYHEVLKDGYRNVYVAFGLSLSQDIGANLGNTITCFSGYVGNIRPDLIVVHGDRMEALAGAVVGALHNIPVAHIEGGELSGTIDESIRHAVSKFAQIHFVCTEEARDRLLQLGEEKNRIFVIGSPDIDIMLGNQLPTLPEAKSRYDIDFNSYGILMYHPVTTEHAVAGAHAKAVVDAVLASGRNFIAVFPNNDLGSELIIKEYRRLQDNPRFRVFPSIRFEHFLTLLRHADFILGNSSAGIRESGVYGIPAIDIGTRQSGRYSASRCPNVQHVIEDPGQILAALAQIEDFRVASTVFGSGDSAQRFLDIITAKSFWGIPLQKHFVDL